MAFLLTETVEDSSALSPARPDLLLFYSGKKTITNDKSKTKVDNNVSDGDLVTNGGGCLFYIDQESSFKMNRWRNSSIDNERPIFVEDFSRIPKL